MPAEIAFKDLSPVEYLGIFFSGGRVAEYIREDEDLLRITRHLFERNERLPWGGDACVCGLLARTPHGQRGQVQVCTSKSAEASSSTNPLWSTAI